MNQRPRHPRLERSPLNAAGCSPGSAPARGSPAPAAGAAPPAQAGPTPGPPAGAGPARPHARAPRPHGSAGPRSAPTASGAAATADPPKGRRTGQQSGRTAGWAHKRVGVPPAWPPGSAGGRECRKGSELSGSLQAATASTGKGRAATSRSLSRRVQAFGTGSFQRNPASRARWRSS